MRDDWVAITLPLQKQSADFSRWRIYGNNVAMARWLQFSVIGGINAELVDLTNATTDTQFNKSGNMRDLFKDCGDASQ